MSKYIYFNIWNNHFKMWGYESYGAIDGSEYRIVCYWGKIADTLQKLQSREKLFYERWGAYDFVSAKIEDKLRKGYVEIENTEYTKYSCGEITLSQLIKTIENRGKSKVSNGGDK